MNCKLYRDLLSLYVGDDLERDEAIAVRAHVGMCADCAREVEEYRSAISPLRESKPTEPGPSLWAGVAAAIAPSSQGEKRPTTTLTLPVKPASESAFAWVACAAALLMGLGVGLVVQQIVDRKTPPTPTPTAVTHDAVKPNVNEREVADNPAIPDMKTDVGTNPGLINDFVSFLVGGDAAPRKRKPGKDLMNPDGSYHLQQVEPQPTSRRVRF